MLRHLFDTFDRRMYSRSFYKTDSMEIFPLSKWDLMMRFVMAFHNGYLGILYDDQHELEKIQQILDSMFSHLPPETIQCRRLMDGTTVIYPMSMTRSYPWSFSRDGEKYVDVCFCSQAPSEQRYRLMNDIRSFRRKTIPRLFDLAFMSCSTIEQSWIARYII